MVDGQIGGNILVARLKFVRDRGGDAMLELVFARLPSADAKVLRGVLLVTSTYPMPLGLRLDDAIAAELSPGDPERVFREMGRASADVNLTGPHRGFIRQGDPHHLLGFAETIYRFYYSAGRRTYERTGARSAVLTTIGAQNVTPADCLTVVGWHERAIELSGGQSVRVEHPKCRARGEDVCQYVCNWE